MFLARADSNARRLLLCLLAPLPIRPLTCPSPQVRALARQTKTCVDTGIHRHTPTKNALKPWRGHAGARARIDYYMHTHTHTRAATPIRLPKNVHAQAGTGALLQPTDLSKTILFAHSMSFPTPFRPDQSIFILFTFSLQKPTESAQPRHEPSTVHKSKDGRKLTPTRPNRQTAHQSSCKILSAWNQPSCECLHGMSLLRPKRLAATWGLITFVQLQKWGPPTSR